MTSKYWLGEAVATEHGVVTVMGYIRNEIAIACLESDNVRYWCTIDNNGVLGRMNLTARTAVTIWDTDVTGVTNWIHSRSRYLVEDDPLEDLIRTHWLVKRNHYALKWLLPTLRKNQTYHDLKNKELLHHVMFDDGVVLDVKHNRFSGCVKLEKRLEIFGVLFMHNYHERSKRATLEVRHPSEPFKGDNVYWALKPSAKPESGFSECGVGNTFEHLVCEDEFDTPVFNPYFRIYRE